MAYFLINPSRYAHKPERLMSAELKVRHHIYAKGDKLDYYKESFWSNTDNGCEVINNCSHDYAFETNTSLVEGQCVVISTVAKLPDAANAATQIEDVQVHERYATKKSALEEKSIRIISKCSLNQDIRHIYILELTYEIFYLIIQFNKFIDYLNPRPEYIRAIIEWPTKSSIPVAHIVAADIQCSLRLHGARRPEGLLCLSSKADADLSFFNIKQDGYDQQVDRLFLSFSEEI
ncbi:unnamed protein product [Rotaria socialis]|uniref:Uncharacterized protein n=1 Tax=Rotaria socialis TaxID=392032 RepID=A0A817SKA8_9BILA|nr:unnamed protein product [Rotaria socialis]